MGSRWVYIASSLIRRHRYRCSGIIWSYRSHETATRCSTRSCHTIFYALRTLSRNSRSLLHWPYITRPNKVWFGVYKPVKMHELLIGYRPQTATPLLSYFIGRTLVIRIIAIHICVILLLRIWDALWKQDIRNWRVLLFSSHRMSRATSVTYQQRS